MNESVPHRKLSLFHLARVATTTLALPSLLGKGEYEKR